MPSVIKKTKQKPAKKVLPVKKEKKFVSESLQKPKAKPGQKKHPKQKRRGVVYIKHLPHGFFEEQLRGYFSQFGAITRLRLARSTRTLGSKGYAFIEFRYPEVAEIAADAMNNYLMFKNIIKTRFIPPSEIKYDYFRSGVSKIKVDGRKMLTSKTIQAREAVIQNTNKLMTDEDHENRTKKVGAKIQKTKQKLAALGIDFDVNSVAENMGEKVMQAAENSKPKTIENLELQSEDEADETFDPAKVDIESDDEFEDFEYDSDQSDDEDKIDGKDDSVKLENAIKIAKAATSKAKIEPAVAKKGKRKEEVEPEIAAKKTKKGKENKSVKASELKVVKKSGKKPVAEESNEDAVKIVEKPAKRAARGKAVEIYTNSEVVVKKAAKKAPPAAKQTKAPAKGKGSAASKADKEPATSPIVAKPAKVAKGKKGAVEKLPVEETVPKQKVTKGKKAQKSQEPELPKTTESVLPKRAAKKVIQPESPAPVKTKKLAKKSTAIEKKKPAKTAEKKLKLAASVVTSSDSTDLVKVVKEVKGKKKTTKK